MNLKNKLIEKAIVQYGYSSEIQNCTDYFIEEFDFFARKDNLRNYTYVVWTVLGGVPECTHILAKKKLFQGDLDCWKYFERTALFWTMSQINDPWIDHMKGVFEYCLYVERNDLIEILFKKSKEYLVRYESSSNTEYKNQKVYASTHLVHFLIDKWLGRNPVKNELLEFGSGYGIYQKLIENWDDFTKIEASYWDSLCDYHLNGLSLIKSNQRDSEEFLASGLVPMELINIIKVRKKLGLDIPIFDHDLFKTPMSKEPKFPSGYDENLDVKFQLVKLTVETKKKWLYDEVLVELKAKYKGKILMD